MGTLHSHLHKCKSSNTRLHCAGMHSPVMSQLPALQQVHDSQLACCLCVMTFG
jgi:hypothetical protein